MCGLPACGKENLGLLPIYYPIWVLKPRPLFECVEAIAAAGFDGVQFGAAPAEDPRRVDTLSRGDAAELRSLLRSLGLGRSLHVLSDFCFAGMAARDEQVVARATESIECAVRALCGEELPPLIVSQDPICLPPGPKGVLAPQLIVEMLQFLVSLRERHAVRPALEHWPKPGAGTPEALRALVEAAGGGIGILLDTGHVNLAMRSDWCEHKTARDFIGSLPAPVLEVHLHDNHGVRDEHLPPGEGSADLAGMLAELTARGFRGPVTLECDLEAPGRPGLAGGLERARRLCAKAVERGGPP